MIRESSIVFNWVTGNNFRFIHPLTPFPEDWKSLVPIEEKRIVKGISRDNFLSYVSAWQERAQTFGAQCVERGDLEAHQYSVCVKRDKLIDAVHIAMGPSRRTGRGGIWSDGWHAFFGTIATPEGIPSYTGVLYSLSGFRNEFNTRGK